MHTKKKPLHTILFTICLLCSQCTQTTTVTTKLANTGSGLKAEPLTYEQATKQSYWLTQMAHEDLERAAKFQELADEQQAKKLFNAPTSDIPQGIPVEGTHSIVLSPYTKRPVDVSKLQPGSTAKCPYTLNPFKVPIPEFKELPDLPTITPNIN